MKRFLSASIIVLLFGFQLSAQERIYTPEMIAPENGAIDQMPNALLGTGMPLQAKALK